METLSELSEYIWGTPMILALIGFGFFITSRLALIQARYWYLGLRTAFGLDKDISSSQKKSGDISSFQALTTALSATIGIGNIVGVSGAILLGGPGAVFWMWVTAFLGMATKFAECFLAVHYRESTSHGFSGGPMYYIQKGLGWRWMGIFFAVSTLVAGLGIGNMVQSNAAAGELFSTDWNVPRSLSGLIIAGLTGLSILGGIKRIGKVTGLLVPCMSFFYLTGCLYIILTNAHLLPDIIGMIFRYAFEPLPALTGSAIGFWQLSIMTGVRRGLFSNEAGMGSASIAAASAKTSTPAQQGLVSMLGPFLDTIFVCSLTAAVVMIGLENNTWDILAKASGSKGISIANELKPHLNAISHESATVWSGMVNLWGQNAIKIQDVLVSSVFYSYLGNTGKYIVTLSVFFFSISTIIGWFYYSDRALIYLGLEKYSLVYRGLWVLCTFLGLIR